jgi:hypothetical protein
MAKIEFSKYNEFLQKNYPVKETSKFYDIIYKSKIESVEDFLKKVSVIISGDNPKFGVRDSSCWAICQKYLGNLSESDIAYTNGRGGIWYIDQPHEFIPEMCKSVQFRHVVEDLYNLK